EPPFGVVAAEGDEATERDERLAVVVDAAVEATGADDDERGGLHAADVAAGPLRGVERGEQTMRQRTAAGGEGRGHRLGHTVAAHPVRLAAEPVANDMTGVGDALISGLLRLSSPRVHDRQ